VTAAAAQPSIGRIVLYRPAETERAHAPQSAEVWPAVITRVWDAERVNLRVLADSDLGAAFRAQVRLDPAGGPRTWCWPARS